VPRTPLEHPSYSDRPNTVLTNRSECPNNVTVSGVHTVKKRLARNLRQALRTRDLTLTEFARLVGVGVSTAHGWTAATHGIRTDHLERAAQVLRMTPSELVA
jgi:hypothetical protein